MTDAVKTAFAYMNSAQADTDLGLQDCKTSAFTVMHYQAKRHIENGADFDNRFTPEMQQHSLEVFFWMQRAVAAA